ncbi:MAG: hypothetical protein VX119_07930 [Bacteroidota bacterium]|nr:hypothetical protein [Bacteroidota bacterium]MEC8756534.1 hypothetical protein [Bacteroidota bacterium]MEC8835704.1 hypothetical protein [Bacteroidota bacterium]
MKTRRSLYSALFTVLMFLVSISQGQIEGISPLWTQEELRTANTTKEARTYMHSSERDIITVLNLARLYPQRFVELELTIEKEDYDYEYKRSLINHMLSMEPIRAVKPNQSMYQLARCWAKESGELGLTGHERIQCNDGFWAECCSYGHDNALGIVLQLLIDYDVPSLGHRMVCLSDDYTGVGATINNHSVWGYVSVLDFYP